MDVVGAPMDMSRRMRVVHDELVDAVGRNPEDPGLAMIDPYAAVGMLHGVLPFRF
jgi:hypothetical protein